MRRSRHAGGGGRPCGWEDGTQVVGCDAGAVLDGRRHCAGDVEDLVALSGGFVGRYVSRNAEHRRAFQGGLGKTCEEVGGTGAERAEANAGTTCDLALGVGHIRGGGFVMGQDKLDPVTLESVEYGEHFATGDTVGALDALLGKEASDGVGNGYGRHGR